MYHVRSLYTSRVCFSEGISDFRGFWPDGTIFFWTSNTQKLDHDIALKLVCLNDQAGPSVYNLLVNSQPTHINPDWKMNRPSLQLQVPEASHSRVTVTGTTICFRGPRIRAIQTSWRWKHWETLNVQRFLCNYDLTSKLASYTSN